MSTIAVDNARPSAGGTSYSLTSGVAKAWVNYSHNVNTINGSNNISSITDDATGVFTVDYTSNFSSSSYGFNMTTRRQGGTARAATLNQGNIATTDIQITTTNLAGTLEDAETNGVTLTGDLA